MGTNEADEDFDTFIGALWRDHDAHTEAVAQRLAGAAARARTPDQLARLAALVVHVHAVHLAQAERGAVVLRALRQSPGHDGSAAAEGPIARGLATLALTDGDERLAAALPPADRISALAVATTAILERDDIDRAIALFGRALDVAALESLPDQGLAVRNLAAAGNNLAQALEDRPVRTAAQTAAMVRAAQAGLDAWQRCGGWLEHERAEYRLARSSLRAGQPQAARAAAERCLAVCAAHDAPPFECFFGHAMLALAQADCGDTAAARAARDAALTAHGQVPADEQRWCADDLKELLARTGAAT